MILAILLSTLSFQITSVILPCPDSLRTLAATTDIETTIIETYASLLKNISLDELYQFQKNPLQIPQSKQLTALSSYQPVLQQLIAFLQRNFEEKERENFILPRLRLLIDAEIQEKIRSGEIQKLKLKISENFQRDFKLSHPGFLSFVLSSDGSTLYSASRHGIIRLWNAKTGDPIRDSHHNLIIWKRRPSWTCPLALSPNSDYLYCGSIYKTIQLCSAKDGEAILDSQNNPIVFKGHTDVITTLALSPNGKILYSSSDDNTIRLWNAKTGEPLRDSRNKPIVRKVQSASIHALVFNTNGKILYSGDKDGIIRVTNERLRSSKKNPIILKAHTEAITTLALNPDGSILYSASRDGTIRLWNAKTGISLRDAQNNPIILDGSKQVKALALSSDGKTLYSGFENGKITARYLPDFIPPEYFEATP